MFCYKQGKICIFCLLCRILIAVAVYSYYAVGVLTYHRTLRIHTEGADLIAVLLGTVHNLAFI